MTSCKLLQICFIVAIISCNSDSKYSYDRYPYDRFDIEAIKVQGSDQSFGLDTLNAVKIEQPKLRSNTIDLLKYRTGSWLFLDNNTLFELDKNFTLDTLAKPGKAPGEIANGRSLIKNEQGIFLIQRNRISRFVPESRKLEVIRNVTDLLFYYEELDGPDSLLVSKYGYTGSQGFQITDRNMKMIRKVGGQLDNKNPELKDMFYEHVRYSSSSNQYLGIFSSLPYLALFNKQLELKKLYKLENFYPIKVIDNQFEKESLTYNSMEWHSYSVPHVTKNGFFIMVVHQKDVRKKQFRFEAVPTVRRFSYYKIDSQDNIEALGESNKVITPMGDWYLYVEDDTLFKANRIDDK